MATILKETERSAVDDDSPLTCDASTLPYKVDVSQLASEEFTANSLTERNRRLFDDLINGGDIEDFYTGLATLQAILSELWAGSFRSEEELVKYYIACQATRLPDYTDPETYGRHTWHHERAHQQPAIDNGVFATISTAWTHDNKLLTYTGICIPDLVDVVGRNKERLFTILGEMLSGPGKIGEGYDFETQIGARFLAKAKTM